MSNLTTGKNINFVRKVIGNVDLRKKEEVKRRQRWVMFGVGMKT